MSATKLNSSSIATASIKMYFIIFVSVYARLKIFFFKKKQRCCTIVTIIYEPTVIILSSHPRHDF